MNEGRLRHLITVLESVKTAQKPFEMATWIDAYENGEGIIFQESGQEEACGTACCALGYGALDERFRQEGLKLFMAIHPKEEEEDESDDLLLEEVPDIETFNAKLKLYGSDVDGAYPRFGGLDGFHAGSEFFGISMSAAEYLFDPYHYRKLSSTITPDEVIARIEYLLANEGKCPEEVRESL